MLQIWMVYYANEGLLANVLLPALVLKTGPQTGRYLLPFRWFLQPVVVL